MQFENLMELCDKITLQNIKQFEIEYNWNIKRDLELISIPGTILKFKTSSSLNIL